jgi:hypothetical protein
MTLRTDLAPAEKVSLGHYTDQLACRVHYRQTADPVLQHQSRGVEDRFFSIYGDHVPRHDIFDLHNHWPSSFSARSVVHL